MQLVEAMFCAFAVVAGASAAAQAPRLPPKPVHRGFADADLGADASLRLTRKQAMQQAHMQHESIHRIDDAESMQIQQEVETMIARLKTLHDSELTAEFAKDLSAVEAALANQTSDKTLANEITAARADLCTELGFETHEFRDCDSFMRTACSPAGRNAKIPQENCTAFFKEEAMALHAQSTEAPATAVAAPPAAAPAAAPMGAPGPALFGGKALRQLPEQGFDGELVEHKNFDTHTGDWQKEFGPNAGHRTFEEICADHPNNEWCRLHGYYPKRMQIKSSAFSSRPALAMLLAVLTALAGQSV